MPVDVYTLEVTPEQAEKLALASTEGKLQFALRNMTDAEDVKTPGVTIAQILGSTDGAKREMAAPPAESAPVKTVEKPPVAKKKTWAPRKSVSVEVIKGTELTKEELSL